MRSDAGAGSRVGRHTETAGRLRTVVLGIDEIAFQVRRKDARSRRARRRGLPKLRNLSQESIEDVRRTCDGCRTKRCHSPSRQAFGDPPHRRVAVEDIRSQDAVHVHVDETRHNEVVVEIDANLVRRGFSSSAALLSRSSISRRKVLPAA